MSRQPDGVPRGTLAWAPGRMFHVEHSPGHRSGCSTWNTRLGTGADVPRGTLGPFRTSPRSPDLHPSTGFPRVFGVNTHSAGEVPYLPLPPSTGECTSRKVLRRQDSGRHTSPFPPILPQPPRPRGWLRMSRDVPRGTLRQVSARPRPWGPRGQRVARVLRGRGTGSRCDHGSPRHSAG